MTRNHQYINKRLLLERHHLSIGTVYTITDLSVPEVPITISITEEELELLLSIIDRDFAIGERYEETKSYLDPDDDIPF